MLALVLSTVVPPIINVSPFGAAFARVCSPEHATEMAALLATLEQEEAELFGN